MSMNPPQNKKINSNKIQGSSGQDPILQEITLKMMMDINIPGKKEPIEFNESMFYSDTINKSGYNSLPYFTSEIEYPSSIIKALPYQQQVDFFFKKSYFLYILKDTKEYNEKYRKLRDQKKLQNDRYKRCVEQKKKNKSFQCDLNGESGLTPDKKKEKREKELDETKSRMIERNNIARSNIMLTLTILFPIKYYNTTFNTYDDLFLNKVSSSFSLSTIMPILLNILIGMKDTSEKYSYLNMNGINTITQIIWLNDIYNHPDYKKLAEKFNTYIEWSIGESIKKNEKIDEEYDIFKDKFKDTLMEISNTKIKITTSRYSSNRDEYTKYIESIKKLATSLSSSFSYNTAKEFLRLYALLERNSSETMRELIRELNEKKNGNNKINVNIGELNKKLTELITLYEIKEFLDDPNIEFQDISNYGDLQKTEYNEKMNRIKRLPEYNKIKEFTDIIKTIKQLSSSNIFLQKQFEDYISGKDNNINELMIPETAMNDDKLRPLIDTGISLNSGTAVIQLRVDIIGGKVDDTNKSKVACIFNGEKLGTELEEILKPNRQSWMLDKYRFYFDMKTETASVIDETKQTVNSTKTSNVKGDEKKPTGKDVKMNPMEKIKKQPPIKKTGTLKKQGGKNRNTIRVY